MDELEDDEERAWQEFALSEFLNGYAPSDAIYDDEWRFSAEGPRSEEDK